jgi:putative hydrolase of the HAD superfamily
MKVHILKAVSYFCPMQPIKNIIFDLGGVFMNLDFGLTQKAFVNLGVTEFAQMFTQHHANDLFEELETGKISAETFYQKFREATHTTLSNEQIKTAWNALILDFPQERMDWLDQINKKYKIFLFSNTNIIHYQCFIDIVRKENGCENFDKYFIKAYYSHNLGLRKPYVASYQKILEEQGLIAAETLFIDDTYKNIEGAQKAGLQTLHLVPPATVLDLGL